MSAKVGRTKACDVEASERTMKKLEAEIPILVNKALGYKQRLHEEEAKTTRAVGIIEHLKNEAKRAEQRVERYKQEHAKMAQEVKAAREMQEHKTLSKQTMNEFAKSLSSLADYELSPEDKKAAEEKARREFYPEYKNIA